MPARPRSMAIVGGFLALASLAVLAQGQPPGSGQVQGQGQQHATQRRQMERSADQIRVGEHHRLQQRERDRGKVSAGSTQAAHVQAAAPEIYGGNLMTERERNAYRERMRAFDTDAERSAFMNQHREAMQNRSTDQNVPIEATAGQARSACEPRPPTGATPKASCMDAGLAAARSQ